MTTFYLDPVNGNDANAGTSFATRWKTLTSGATAARVAPGDVIRIIASADPVSVGQNATWTNNSASITLVSGVTVNIDNCDTAWTASANVTATASTTTKREGTGSANIAIATAFTTGLVAYHATGALDLSAYQQVSLMIRSSVALASGVLTLTLCSDAAGATPVHTITIPAIAANVWMPVVFDNAGALSASIASVALNAVSDPGTPTINIDNIVACKASASADAITHASLLGKPANLSWAATTAYSAGDKRRPTPPNRTGFTYKVTAITTGTSAGAEPTWPIGLGQTVVDGGVTWTCYENEDTWYPIAAISGTAITFEGAPNLANNTAVMQGKYQGETETVTLYRRETTKDPNATTSASTAANTVQDSGTAAGGYITFSGGWNTTDMSTQMGETWWDGVTAAGTGIISSSKNFLSIEHLNYTRYGTGVSLSGSASFGWRFRHVHALACAAANYSVPTNDTRVEAFNLQSRNTSAHFSSTSTVNTVWNARCVTLAGSTGASIWIASGGYNDINYMWAQGNATNSTGGLGAGSTVNACWLRVRNLISANNAGAVISSSSGGVELVNPLFGEANPIGTFNAGYDGEVNITKYNQTADDHRTYADGGSIQTTTAQRHTASGVAWVFNPTSTARIQQYPLRMRLARIVCDAGVTRNLTIWTRRDNTNINGRLMVRGGQIAGVPDDVYVDCAPTINTWVQSGTLTFTPTEKGVIEVLFLVWDGVGTTNSFWIDDLGVS